ncbi:polysaccharide deacetylase [uncultured Roseobacter sp.]|uniref:polysaccharide deacetylase family protein n=1 Tax=uncultured Roseobacter sp. TaxID=114847 RepID=UPI0026038E33|nr:polysaccharide deacetylase [uncultured Roseobacter sp.]
MTHPSLAKTQVTLTFDFDAESLWMSLGLTSPQPMSRGTYGANVGIDRILALLEREAIRATFFVPGETARRHPDKLRAIVDAGHEIGHHGDIHEAPATLTLDGERAALSRGMDALIAATGKRPVGYRSPSWDFSENTLGLLQEFGFAWDSSLMGDDFHTYELTSVDQQESGIVELPVSYELDDAPYYLFAFPPAYMAGMSDPEKVLRIWEREYEGAAALSGLFNLTMHPQITGRYSRIQVLERLIKTIKDSGQAEFVTCSDAVATLEARK